MEGATIKCETSAETSAETPDIRLFEIESRVFKLRKSCTGCYIGKVRCNGRLPCERCTAKGCACVYTHRKQRPSKNREPRDRVQQVFTHHSEPSEGEFTPSVLITEREQRLWGIFFTLYKHYAFSCSNFWFNQQLVKILAVLREGGNVAAEQRLKNWMRRENVLEARIKMEVELCKLGRLYRQEVDMFARGCKVAGNFALAESIRDEYGTVAGSVSWAYQNTIKPESDPVELSGKIFETFSIPEGPQGKPIYDVVHYLNSVNRGAPMLLPVSGRVEGADISLEKVVSTFIEAPSRQVIPAPFFEESAQGKPVLSIRIDYFNLTSNSVVRCSPAFFEMFGISAETIERDLADSGGGFLPWGADTLSRICVRDVDLLVFVQSLALQFNTAGRPCNIPVCRSIRSAHNFLCATKGPSGKEECLIHCLHREFITMDHEVLDVRMEFAQLDIGDPAGSLNNMQCAPYQIELAPPLLKRARLDVSDCDTDSSSICRYKNGRRNGCTCIRCDDDDGGGDSIISAIDNESQQDASTSNADSSNSGTTSEEDERTCPNDVFVTWLDSVFEWTGAPYPYPACIDSASQV